MQQKQKEIHRGILENNQPMTLMTQGLGPGLELEGMEGLEGLELEQEAPLLPIFWNLKDNPSNPNNVFTTGINQETLKQFDILNSE